MIHIDNLKVFHMYRSSVDDLIQSFLFISSCVNGNNHFLKYILTSHLFNLINYENWKNKSNDYDNYNDMELRIDAI